MTSKAHVALYGSVAMRRAYCKACSGMALVVQGQMACCDAPTDVVPTAVKRMAAKSDRRKAPSIEVQREILALQQNCCLYCDAAFGSTQVKRGRAIRLTVEWDHLIPFSYTGSCHSSQFVASCHVCNSLKSSRMYQDIDQACADLRLRREAKGCLW